MGPVRYDSSTEVSYCVHFISFNFKEKAQPYLNVEANHNRSIPFGFTIYKFCPFSIINLVMTVVDAF